VLCVTAKSGTQLPDWVTPGPHRLDPYVSFHQLRTCRRIGSCPSRARRRHMQCSKKPHSIASSLGSMKVHSRMPLA
jgi:hypothetical protein